MCYPLPGPRCSSHTRANLIAARLAWQASKTDEAKERYFSARDEYDTSPEGIARNQSLLAHHIKNGLSTRYVKTRLAMGEQTRADGVEAMRAKGIAVKEEATVTPYDSSGRDVEGFDETGIASDGTTTVEQAEEYLRKQTLSEKDYEFLKEMGPKHWTPADRKAMQEYSTAVAALNVAKAAEDGYIDNPVLPEQVSVAEAVQIPTGIALRPWEHPTTGKVRHYLNDTEWKGNNIEKALGYEITRYNTGNLSTASFNGEHISNTRAREELSAIGKVWIEVDDDGQPVVKNTGGFPMDEKATTSLIALYNREVPKQRD